MKSPDVPRLVIDVVWEEWAFGREREEAQSILGKFWIRVSASPATYSSTCSLFRPLCTGCMHTAPRTKFLLDRLARLNYYEWSCLPRRSPHK